jgi:hypothetical protein
LLMLPPLRFRRRRHYARPDFFTLAASFRFHQTAIVPLYARHAIKDAAIAATPSAATRRFTPFSRFAAPSPRFVILTRRHDALMLCAPPPPGAPRCRRWRCCTPPPPR